MTEVCEWLVIPFMKQCNNKQNQEWGRLERARYRVLIELDKIIAQIVEDDSTYLYRYIERNIDIIETPSDVLINILYNVNVEGDSIDDNPITLAQLDSLREQYIELCNNLNTLMHNVVYPSSLK